MSEHGQSKDGYDFAHPISIPLMLSVFGALLALTILTVAQASFDIGSLDIVIVMVIATIKAGLVMAFFMHLAYDKPFNVIVFLSSFAFVALFLIFTMGDSKLTSVDFEPKVDDEASEVSEVAVVDTLEQVAATESEQATVEMEETVTE